MTSLNPELSQVSSSSPLSDAFSLPSFPSSPSTTTLASSAFTPSDDSAASVSPATTPSDRGKREASPDLASLFSVSSQPWDQQYVDYSLGDQSTRGSPGTESSNPDEAFYTPAQSPRTSPPGSLAGSSEGFFDAFSSPLGTHTDGHDPCQNSKTVGGASSATMMEWDGATSTVPSESLGLESVSPALDGDRKDSVFDAIQESRSTATGKQDSSTVGLSTAVSDDLTLDTSETQGDVLGSAYKIVGDGPALEQDMMVHSSYSPSVPSTSVGNHGGQYIAGHQTSDGLSPPPQPAIDITSESPLQAVIANATQMKRSLDQSEVPNSMREGLLGTTDGPDMTSASSTSRTFSMVTDLAAGFGEKMNDITQRLRQDTAGPSQGVRRWGQDTGHKIHDTLMTGTAGVMGWFSEAMPSLSEYKDTATSRLPSVPDWNVRQRAREWRNLLPSTVDNAFTGARDRMTSKFSGWERPNMSKYTRGATDRLHDASSAFGGFKKGLKSKWNTGFKSGKPGNTVQTVPSETSPMIAPSVAPLCIPQSTVDFGRSTAAASTSSPPTAERTPGSLFGKLTSAFTGLKPRLRRGAGAQSDISTIRQPESNMPKFTTLQKQQEYVSSALDSMRGSDGATGAKGWGSSCLSMIDDYLQKANETDPLDDIKSVLGGISAAATGLWR